MTKRRSVEEFRETYARFVKGGKLVAFREYLEVCDFLTDEQKQVAEKNFMRDAAEELRLQGHDPK
jgi:hypothetical protein